MLVATHREINNVVFIDSSVRLKYDRQLEHTWNQSVIQVLTHTPWLAGVSEHACVCVCGSGFVPNIVFFY